MTSQPIRRAESSARSVVPETRAAALAELAASERMASLYQRRSRALRKLIDGMTDLARPDAGGQEERVGEPAVGGRTSRAARARTALDVLGENCPAIYRRAAEAVIADPGASMSVIGARLGMTKDAAAGNLWRLIRKAGKAVASGGATSRSRADLAARQGGETRRAR